MRARVLVVDDDRNLCELVSDALTMNDLEVRWTTTADEGRALLDEESFDLVLVDVVLRESSGLDLCRRIAQGHPEVPVIVMTAYGSMDTAVGAIRAGAYDFLSKPFAMEALALTVARALRHQGLTREVQRLREDRSGSPALLEAVGESPAMRAVATLIERIAPSEANVLITGESGTGKELAARAIHRLSPRASGPFVSVNCAALPESLLESELFGHAKGAFTDARSARPGLFQRASGGVLLLDEIGELPMATQPKLLRALQERAVRPVGSDREVPADVRVLAATNRDIDGEVAEGRFREDLYYRVNIVRVEMPPLRARGNDVLLLAQHFLERSANRSGKPVVGLTPDAAEKLLQYDFPGNVRELENSIERGVALARYEHITVEDLPEKIRSFCQPPVVVESANPEELLPMDEVERRYIMRVLRASGGNKTQAAKILGFDRRTLYRKLDRFGLG